MDQNTPRFAPPPDAETQWRQFEQHVQTEYQHFFDGQGPIVGARAPGRLDVMGGVADYSGSLVLEMPIAEAACVAWQWREDRQLRIRSAGAHGSEITPEILLSLDELITPDGFVRPLAEVRERLTRQADTRWVAYIAGCYYVMLHAYARVTQGRVDSRLGEWGANILLESNVPLGAGVSSSAAIEVATMHALSEEIGRASCREKSV